MQDFRRLLVWQRAHAFVLDAHVAIAAIPQRGNAELKAQMRRALDSIPTTLLKGAHRHREKNSRGTSTSASSPPPSSTISFNSPTTAG